MSNSSLLKQTLQVYARHNSILMVVLSQPAIVVAYHLSREYEDPPFPLLVGLLWVLWSISTIITNILSTYPRDLQSLMIFPLNWKRLILARNATVFLMVAASIALAIIVVSILERLESTRLLFLLPHLGAILLIAVGIGNILSVVFPRPFRQHIFCWKGMIMLIVPWALSGLIVISNLFGSLIRTMTVLAFLISSFSFYRWSIFRAAEILRLDILDVLRKVDA